MKIKIRSLRKTHNISKTQTVDSLKGVDLDISNGSFVAVVGPSGSGKTTLFNIIGCIDSATTGTVFLDDINITCLPEPKKEYLRKYSIGYVFQFFNLIPILTAQENASMPFWIGSLAKRRKGCQNIERLFRAMDIFELKNRYPKEMSGGQQQRVAIARALANGPSLVLADEPTGNLDSKSAIEIITLMKKESKENNSTFIVATHDTSLLEYFDSIIHLHDGMVEKAPQNKSGECS